MHRRQIAGLCRHRVRVIVRSYRFSDEINEPKPDQLDTQLVARCHSSRPIHPHFGRLRVRATKGSLLDLFKYLAFLTRL